MYRTILVPVDGSDAARDALRHAVGLAEPLGATVHVLAVVEPSGSPLAFDVDDVDEMTDAVRDLADAIAAAEDASDGADSPGVTITSEVRRARHPHEAIREYADETGADAIVLGRHGTTSLPEAVLGSTADRLARLSAVPVVLVPGPDEDEDGES